MNREKDKMHMAQNLTHSASSAQLLCSKSRHDPVLRGCNIKLGEGGGGGRGEVGGGGRWGEVKVEICKLGIRNSQSENSCMPKPEVLTFDLGLIISEFRLATL